MEVRELEFGGKLDHEAVAGYLEAIARDMRASKFSFESDGEKLQFDVMGLVEFELEADYNVDKKKYSVKLEMDWRHT